MAQAVKSIGDIQYDWEHNYYVSKIQVPGKLGEYHVFDEDKSVKWNKEMVAKHNAQVEELRDKKFREQSDLHVQFTEDVISYIMDEYDMNRSQADLVQQFVYAHWHAFMSEYFSHIDTIASFASSLIEEERKVVSKST